MAIESTWCFSTNLAATWAASLGDRSENADYTFNKRLLHQICFLREFLPEVTMVDYSPQQEGKVFFGAWVEIKNNNRDMKKFRIVGPEEIYGYAKEYISINSLHGSRSTQKRGE